jgi:amidohydrolase
VTAAQVISGLQTVVSRQVDITRNPAVLSVGIIRGGVRSNIIPDRVELSGTIRTFEEAQYQQVTQAARRMVEQTAAANGATAEFTLEPYRNPVLNNDPSLTTRLLPTLRKVAGAANVGEIPLITAGEDFRILLAAGTGLLFLRRRDAAGQGRHPGGVQPLAVVLPRRDRAAARDARLQPAGDRLPVGQ